MVGAAGQRVFLWWARPLAPVGALLAYLAVWLARPEDELLQIVAVLGVAAVVGLGYVVATLAWPAERVLRVALPVDTLLIAGMTAALEHPDELAIAYFWSIALASILLGPRDVLVNTAVAIACAAVVPPLTPFPFEVSVVATDVIVLALVGGLFAYFARNAESAQEALARERALDAAALAITQRVRSTLDLGEVLTAMLRELGDASGAERALLRLRATGVLYQWDAPGVEPLDLPEPPGFIRRLYADGGPLAYGSADEADAEARAFLDAIGSQSLLAFPIRWHGGTVAVLGYTDSRPRDWRRDVLPLCERLSPQLGAALAQAELFEQQQATLDEFRDLSRLREELVANVSHELRTPLTSTIGFLETLKARRAQLDEASQEEFVALALREARRLARLVDDLLDLARTERGVMSLELAPVHVRDVVERAALGISSRGRELRLLVPDDLVVHGDDGRLLQVFGNLLANAFKHGAGRVTVRAEHVDRQVRVTVCDAGAGVPPDRISDLFVPFARWGSDAESTGLGLAIARGIVHAHGGALFYRPASEGVEHAFIVTLPREGPAANPHREEAA